MNDDIRVALASLEISPALEGDPDDVLRPFSADVLANDGSDDDEHPAGRIKGYIVAAHWDREHHDLREAGDRYDGDTELLGSAADNILDMLDDVETALLIELIVLDEGWRGNRLARDIVHEVLAVLGLDIERTAVVLVPEPMTETGRLEPGPVRDRALQHLQAAYSQEGFEPWDDSSRVWWLPPWT